MTDDLAEEQPQAPEVPTRALDGARTASNTTVGPYFTSSESTQCSTSNRQQHGLADTHKRLLRDFKRIRDDPPEGITATPHEADIMKWTAVIFGPPSTPWDGGIFKLDLQFTDDYPMLPPKVTFRSNIFHPNVYVNGAICMDIMKSQWSPAFDVAALLLCIQSLLGDPNPNSAANPQAAEMFSANRALYEDKVRSLVEESLDAAEDF